MLATGLLEPGCKQPSISVILVASNQATHLRERFFIFNDRIGEAVETIEKIKKQLTENTILLYMKGTPKMPQCGFSAKAVQCIDACGIDFAYVDVLAQPDIRQTLPQYADWPTFPQLYVKWELIGGSDIIAELYQNGELKSLLHDAIGQN